MIDFCLSFVVVLASVRWYMKKVLSMHGLSETNVCEVCCDWL